MKMHLLRTSILAAAAAVAVHAQTLNFRVNVPFDFIVGSQTLPAGQYSVDVKTVSRSVSLHCIDRRGAAEAIGLPLPAADGAQNQEMLVFHRYNNTYFLTQVWGNGSDGRKLPTTKRERELAAQKVNADNITVVALR
jgi:hypothetical protein